MKTKTLITFFAFYVFTIVFSSNAKAQTSIFAGNVYGTWTTSGSPYNVFGNIIVPLDSLLTIDPGVVVNFQGHYKFFINGRIHAIGSITDTISFTASNASTGWWGIRFDGTPSSQDSSFFRYCKIRRGKTTAGTFPDGYGGAFLFNAFSKIRISNSLISNNYASVGGGIAIFNSSPLISNNYIINNNVAGSYGGGIDCESSSSPIITGNIIKNNTANSSGGGIFCQSSSPYIYGNTISYNAASLGGGINIDGCSGTIINNIITNNSNSPFAYGGGGIYVNSSPLLVISGDVICNNTALNGGGISFSSSNSKVINCTISNNLATGAAGGGGIYCESTSNPIFVNTIITNNSTSSGNGKDVYISDNPSDPSFDYCDILGGISGIYTNGNPYTGAYTNNINANPLFVVSSGGAGSGFNGITANWSEQATSPCINAGIPSISGLNLPLFDVAGNSRVSGGRIDIGAYESLFASGIVSLLSKNDYSIFPNPNSGTFIIQSSKFDDESFEVYNMLGEFVYQSKINTSNLEIDLSKEPKGVYFIRILKDNKAVWSNKLVLTN